MERTPFPNSIFALLFRYADNPLAFFREHLFSAFSTYYMVHQASLASAR